MGSTLIGILSSSNKKSDQTVEWPEAGGAECVQPSQAKQEGENLRDWAEKQKYLFLLRNRQGEGQNIVQLGNRLGMAISDV